MRLRSGLELTYDHLIGADGVNSVVAKTLYGTPFDKKKIGLALEIEVDRTLVDRSVVNPEIYFGFAHWGYGWVFPKTDTYTVGLFGTHVKNPNLREDFITFIKTVVGDVPVDKIKGHHIPFGDFRKVPGMGDVLLVGDAAGLVEPITGEGIAFAMQSGYFAASSIVEAARSGRGAKALDIYREKHREIAQLLRQANFLRCFIYPKPSEYLLVKALPKSRELPRKHMDLLAGELEYGEYARYLVRKVVRKIGRRLSFQK